MKTDTQELVYPWAETTPDCGQAMELADGLRWLRMPLPFALDHVNLWLLRDELDGRAGWTVVDCGVDQAELRQAWETVFEHGLDGLPILRVLVTHMHPDHVGLAHWLCERWQVDLWMSMSGYLQACLWSGAMQQCSGTPDQASMAEYFARHGLCDANALAQMRARQGFYGHLVPRMPVTFHRLLGGQKIRIGDHEWQLITGYGHAPEHISLWCPTREILIAGDMVLPRISTNISVFGQEPEGNPLPLYLESLHAYDALPADALVLPSHGKPFRGLHERIAQQQQHHADRLADVLIACAQPRSAYDLLPILFQRELDVHQLGFAMGEAIAHLHAQFFAGRLKRTLGQDGIYRFQCRHDHEQQERA